MTTIEDLAKRLEVLERKVLGNEVIQAGTYYRYKGFDNDVYAFVYDVNNGIMKYNCVWFSNDNTVVYKRKVTRNIEEFLTYNPVKIDYTDYIAKLNLAKELIV